MEPIIVRVTGRPPVTQQIEHRRGVLHARARFTLVVGMLALVMFSVFYLLSEYHTQSDMVFTLDLVSIGTLLVGFGAGIYYTKVQLSLQLLQPITEEGVRDLRTLSTAHATILWYLNQVQQQQRTPVEVEAKVLHLYAQGYTDVEQEI